VTSLQAAGIAGEGEVLGPGTVNNRYATWFVDELVQAGLSHACLCPGSRSTPLALALAQNIGVGLFQHVDERSAAFFGLGMAKSLRRPVALVSTSGTAAANFFPALIEAEHSHTPLIVLTADRPHQMRGSGALQTIDQIKLFGDHVKWFAEVAPPDIVLEDYCRSVSRRAWLAACESPSGPVHLNFPFAEPLLPEDGASSGLKSSEGSTLKRRVSIGKRRLDSLQVHTLASELRGRPHGLIVCGPQDDPALPDGVTALSAATGYPVLAEALSQVRCGPGRPSLQVDSYDLILRSRKVVDRLRPDAVIRFGATPVSKPLLTYLDYHTDALQIVVDEGAQWRDQPGTARVVVDADPAALALGLANEMQGSEQSAGWAKLWSELSSGAREAAFEALRKDLQLSEPKSVAVLATVLRDGDVLFVGNSMPARDVDAFFPASPVAIRFLGNRGVNGIDGLVSSAMGAAATSRGRTLLILGDLSFYHDLNGLLAAKLHALDLTVILLNNDGGGIFSFLPVGELDRFERIFATPTGLNFSAAVEMYGGHYHRPDNDLALENMLTEALASPGLDVIEVVTHREANVALHRRLWQAALDRIEADSSIA